MTAIETARDANNSNGPCCCPAGSRPNNTAVLLERENRYHDALLVYKVWQLEYQLQGNHKLGRLPCSRTLFGSLWTRLVACVAMSVPLANVTHASTIASADDIAVDEDENVVLVREGDDLFMIDRNGMHRVTAKAIQRSPVLTELKEAPGTSSLPVSRRIFRMWLDLVATGADSSTWTDDVDLCNIAQVQMPPWPLSPPEVPA